MSAGKEIVFFFWSRIAFLKFEKKNIYINDKLIFKDFISE
jgi:hypothetical protein